MPKPSLDALRTPANGQIYSLNGALSKNAVEAAFRAASEKASGKAVAKTIREKRAVEGTNFWASFICFPLIGCPAFQPGTNLEEKTYGFLLLLEVQVNAKWYLGVFKHGAANLNDWLDEKAMPLQRGKLINAFSDGSTVSKISVQRMSVSKYELRAASYEAADLQASLPMMAATRCAIRSIRFHGQTAGSIAVTIGTSRVQQSGGRCQVDSLADLIRTVAEETQADKHHAFLETFAQAIPISDLPAGTLPTSLLFDWSVILEDDSLELCKIPDPGEVAGKQISKTILQRVLGDTLPLIAEGQGWMFAKIPGHSRGTLALSTTKYSVKTVLGNKLAVHDIQTDETMPLAKWARENNAYSITFSQPEYFFGGGALYRRAGFAKEVEMVRRCLRAEISLANAKSEKGKPRKSDSQFPVNSIFGLVENSIYTVRDWLCCTDLGDEWADYICIRNQQLFFIHCKGGKQTTGASSFQEVIGQALKNLGRICSTPAEFSAKLKATQKTKFWSGTKIERLRDQGRTWANFQSSVTNLLSNPEATREVHLVVTLLSKNAFDAAAAAAVPTPHFIQLIWLLASFVNSCREMGAKPTVLCKQ